MNTRRKDTKETFASSDLYAGRFTENVQNMETCYFHILTFFIYVSPNFTLDSRIIEYLQCHSLILVWLSFEKLKKRILA